MQSVKHGDLTKTGVDHMKLPANREYKLKFYLNAEHYVILSDNKGELHPHTWEIQLHFGMPRTVFREFTDIEKNIEQYLNKYQNKVLNEISPFDRIVPTLENMTDCFAEDCFNIIEKLGGVLYSIETAETPTRTYCVTLNDYNTDNKKESVESIVERIVKTHE